MRRVNIEIAAGVFVLVGIICIGYLAVRFGKMQVISDDSYELYGRFSSVDGLKPGASIEIAGVQVGQVGAITLDQKRQVAVVKLRVRKDVVLSDDVIASVKTAGLIGDKYIKLFPGGSDQILKEGDEIIETESAVDLEELISKYVFGEL
jgi:phospholipid/cholesterol/gamma-HCH transport system substrate-binding protein